MSLYRKHRPQQFSDLIGQDHIIQTLISALQGGNFSHAYLFSGPKGSGKTTTARLLAKALNCQGRKLAKNNFEPCGKCLTCLEITKGNSLDMIEIDAASNRGIDEIRELRDKIRFAPTSNTYKIYIIDECHMLTKEAFNALLKTLEEPPAHAVFILATTEIHKIPATILSRTQSFVFKKATFLETLKLLKKTAKIEKIKITDDALELIARISYGAYRDALSLLDQVASLGGPGEEIITLEKVQTVLGQTTEKLVWEFVSNLLHDETQKTLEIIERIYFDGKDLENFIAEVVLLLRRSILVKEGLALEFELSKEEKERLVQLTATTEVEVLVEIIEKLVSVINKVKTSVLGQLPLEMVVVEIAQSAKLKTQNKDIKESNIPQSNPIILKPEPPKPEKIEITTSPSQTTSEPKKISGTESVKFDESKWQQAVKIVKSHNNALAATLKSAVFQKTTDHHIILAVKFKFHAEQICNKKNLVVIESAILKTTGTQYKVDCVVNKELDLAKPKDKEEEILDRAKEVFEVEE